MSPKIQTIKGGHTKLEILFQIVNLKNYDEVYKGEDGSPDSRTGGKEIVKALYPKTTV